MIWNFLKRIFKNWNKGEVKIPEDKAPVVVVVTSTNPPKVNGEPKPDSKLVQVIDNINNGTASAPDWTYLITTCRLDPDKKASVLSVVKKQQENWARYKFVSEKTGVPASAIANIHQKESSLGFDKCLHNGDKAIGNGKKTWQVPKGRGPFETWEEAAIDALMMKKNIFPAEWTTVNTLIFCQRYNGLGHQNKGLEYSPYIWAYTSHHDETGNYIADGKYSSTAVIKSPGIMALMLVQEELALL